MLDTVRKKLASAISPKADNRVPLGPYQILSMQTADIPIYTELTVRKAVREGYKISGHVYRAIGTIVQAASVIPWVVLDKEGEIIPDHDFAKVWAKPNPQFSGQNNMEFIIAHLLLVGNALMQPIIVGGRPREFWVVMPDLVKPIPSDVFGGLLRGYEVTSIDGKQQIVPPDQFVHFMKIDPGNPFWGTGPLQAIARTVDTDNEAQDTQKISMQNRAIPDGVFEVGGPKEKEKPLTPEQYEEADRRIKEHYLSKEKRRMPWVIAGAVWHQMSLTPVEMDFIASRAQNTRDIAAVYGLDPWLLGDRSASTYNNVMEARKALYREVVLPLLEVIKATLNLKIAPMYGGDITISYDTSKIAALREDQKEKAEIAKIFWAMGVPFDQINERLELGYREFPGSGRSYLPMNLLPTAGSSAQEQEQMRMKMLFLGQIMGFPVEELQSTYAPPLQIVESTIVDKALNLQTEEQKTVHWKRIDMRRVAWWGVIAKKVKLLYNDEAKAVEKALKDIKSKIMTPRDWEEAYSENPPHWAVDLTPSLFAQEFVKELTDRKLESVLEIGCGNGRDSIFFARAGLDVTAIDVAPSAIKLAEENAKEAGVDIDFKVANAEKLPFKDDEFDSVFSLSVLHSTKLKKSLPEVNRVLADKGLAFIYLYGDTEFADGKVEKVISVDDYVKLVESLGFTMLDFYDEQEADFDEFGEKHLMLVSLLQKEGEPK